MRTLNAQELTAVAGGAKTGSAPSLSQILAALAAKGITFALDGTQLTITTPQGSKTLTLPQALADKLAALTATTAAA